MSKIVACNNIIKDIHYSGFTISKIYACGGQLVYSADTTPPIVVNPIARVYVDGAWVDISDTNNDGILTQNEVNASLSTEQFNNATTLFLYDNCTELGSDAFRGSPITNIGSFGMIGTIGNGALSGCTNLTSVYLPCNIIKVGSNAFMNCSSLSSVTVCNTSSAFTIGDYAFTNDSNLTNLDLGRKLTSIGMFAFSNCNIGEVTIPSTVTEIKQYAFYYNQNMTKIVVNCTTPPTIGNNVFTSTNNCPIVIPDGTKDTYIKPDYYPWSTYSSRFKYAREL